MTTLCSAVCDILFCRISCTYSRMVLTTGLKKTYVHLLEAEMSIA